MNVTNTRNEIAGANLMKLTIVSHNYVYFNVQSCLLNGMFQSAKIVTFKCVEL